ncbi:MAG: acyltransferase [Bacteroidia bacterium]
MSKRIGKIEQLDSLRAFAAFSVIIYHFLPVFNLGSFPLGWIGVDLFFVFSGYLITAILLEQKSIVNKKFIIVKNFIIKRALRLFPAYYLFITFFLFLMIVFRLYIWDKGDAVYYYTYTQNILFFKNGMKGTQLNHLWTLAVEEQFYIFWPWLVIYIDNKKLLKILFVTIIITLLFKSFTEIDRIRMLTFYHFDTLGSGALIAVLIKEKGQYFLSPLYKFKYLIILLSMITLTISLYFKIPHLFIVSSVLMLSVSLLIGSLFGFKGIVGKILNLPKLKYLGKISYGLYLYHKPIPYFINLFNQRIFRLNNFIALILGISLTIIIAHLSYNLLEKRFLKLKEKFDL